MANIILGPIIGGLSHQSVNLWARADRPATLHAWLASKSDLSDAKLMGKNKLTEYTGFAGVIPVDGLLPAKKYFFALTLDRKRIPSKENFHSFSTFPAPGKAKPFRFAFGSCFLPKGLNPGRAFEHMLNHQDNLSFLLMLGDQIYADEWRDNGLGHVASSIEDYRQVYLNTWSNCHHRAVLAHTPVFMTLDDHEVDNDWYWQDFAQTKASSPLYTRVIRWLEGRPKEERLLDPVRLLTALQANWEHQMMHAPGCLQPDGPLAYQFEYGATAFFIMDTRTQRVVGKEGCTILGKQQWDMLINWLRRVKDSHPVKFIITSSSILTYIFGDITKEHWPGCKEERDRLFFFLANEGIEGVHFLAGDLHSAHAVCAELNGPNGKSIPVWEFCSSPFEQNTNILARVLQHPVGKPALHDGKRHFIISENNYGVINVDFANKKNPCVTFELNYEEDGQWKMIQAPGVQT